ncbi:MAG: hypothetical protein MRY72_01890, partial [Aquisalinus sp.]|nr:hypothetical protein [Aquisalinus sp.]
MEHGVSAHISAPSGSENFLAAKLLSALVISLWLIASFASPASAQGLASPSAGCTAANLGSFDLDPVYTNSPDDQLQELTFTDEFAADETLQFIIDATGTNPDTREDTIEPMVFDDTLGIQAVNFPNEVINSVETGNYVIPADGDRTFTLSLMQNTDFSEGRIQISCLPTDTGTITITKQSDVTGTFAFTGDLGSFQLTAGPGAPGTRVFDNLTAGSFTITETIDADFDVTVLCSDTTTGTNSVTIDLAPGADIECVFTNTQKTGTITITKQSDVTGTFAFTGDLGSFNLMPTASQPASLSFDNLSAGTFRISETLDTDFIIEEIICTNGDQGDTQTGVLTVKLEPDDHVTCTFKNVQKTGSITIVKQIDNDESLFRFTSNNLGQFSIQT